MSARPTSIGGLGQSQQRGPRGQARSGAGVRRLVARGLLAGPTVTRAVTLAGYGALVAWLMVCEVRARRSDRLPTLPALVRSVTRPALVRALLLAAWLWLGWHLFVRAHR